MRLKQVVLNLASNSVKFVQRGFIRLTAEIRPDGFLQIAVEDSGPGVPEAKRQQLPELNDDFAEAAISSVGERLGSANTTPMGGRFIGIIGEYISYQEVQ